MSRVSAAERFEPPMIVRYFLQWAQTATAAQRAEGAGALARAWLFAEMDAASGATRNRADVAARRSVARGAAGARRQFRQRRRGAARHRLGARLRSVRHRRAAAVALAAAHRRRADRLRRHRRRLRPERHRPASAPFGRRRRGARRGRRPRGGDFARRQSRGRSPEFSMRRIVERFGHDAETARRCWPARICPPRCATNWCRRRPRR